MTGQVNIVGAGGWGTALAVLLARKGIRVLLYARRPEIAAEIAVARENRRLLPGIRFPDGVTVTADISRITEEKADAIVMAVPSHGLRAVAVRLKEWRKSSGIVMSVVKGLEEDTLLPPSGILKEAMGVEAGQFCVLSGPSHAEEVAREIPTAVVAAGSVPATVELVQKVFHTPRFRVYTRSDVTGVELGGALKNVIAIACGVGDGLGFGDNTRAAIITRGLAEITRLGVARGARRETFWGLAGVGDLVVTCDSAWSRNRGLGLRIGRGESLDAILTDMQQVAEGVHASRAACRIARSLGVEIPITEQVRSVLFEGKPPSQGMKELLSREARSEEEPDYSRQMKTGG